MFMNLPHARHLFLFGLGICVALIGSAFYLQYVEDLEPCPMCMAQRIMVYLASIVFLLGAAHNPVHIGRRIYAGVILLASLGGAGLASRQLWLQGLPEDQVPACGPDLDYMLEVFPWQEVITVMLRGTGDCAEVQWTFLSLSIPGWSLLWFTVLAALALIIWLRKPIQIQN